MKPSTKPLFTLAGNTQLVLASGSPRRKQFLDDLGLKSLADLPPLLGDMPQSKEFELVFGDEPSEEKDKTAESAEGVADRPQERAETE